MRLIVDSLIALMLVAILATVILHYRHSQREMHEIRFVHDSLARLHEQAIYHRAMEQVRDAQQRHARTVSQRPGFPEQIAPAWFEGHLPMNVLVSLRHPWIDLAPPGDRHDHPPDPVIENREQAGFWYNPQRGVFRARVPQQFSAERTLEIYNRVNGTELSELPIDDDPARAPRPHTYVPDPEQRAGIQAIRTTELDEHLDLVTTALPTMLSLTLGNGRGEQASDDEDAADAEAESLDDRQEPTSEPEAAEPDAGADDHAAPERPTLQSRSRPRNGV